MNRRIADHGVLALVTILVLAGAAMIGPSAGMADRLSIASAYLCLFLLAIALLIGPANVLTRGRPLPNSYFRRDVGIWAAMTGLLHFYLGNVLSMNFAYLESFVENAALPPSPAVREALYMWGTVLGYLVAVVFLILLFLSNDWMIRKVGVRWWKRLQRSSYAGFLFTVLHAFAFQILEARASRGMFIVAFVTLCVMAVQGYCVLRLRSREPRPEAHRSRSGML